MFGFCGQVFAADTASLATAENAAAVKKGVEELGKLFAVEAPPQKAEPQKIEVDPAPQKSMADVMDKAIDKVSDVVGAMAKAISNIAPEVWRIMVRQQYAKGIAFLIVPFLLTLVLVAGFFASKARYDHVISLIGNPNNPERADSDEAGFFWFLKIAFTVFIGLSFVWLANRITDAALFLINPEFYAIQDLLRMILNKGM